MSGGEDMTADEFGAALDAGEPVELERRRPRTRLVSSTVDVWFGPDLGKAWNQCSECDRWIPCRHHPDAPCVGPIPPSEYQ